MAVTTYPDCVCCNPLIVPCCPNSMRRQLVWTMTSPCAEINGLSGTLTYLGDFGAFDSWESGPITLPAGTGVGQQGLVLHCDHASSTWRLDSPTSLCWSAVWTLATVDCGPPFTVEFDTIHAVVEGCPSCSDGDPVTVLITEPP
jgi:hypothetical protein